MHALGLIFTELLTGAAPYSGADTSELYAAILSPRRPSPARVGIDVGCWEAVLERALAFRPADRFQDAGALLRALAAEVPKVATASLSREVPSRESDYATTVPRTTVRRTSGGVTNARTRTAMRLTAASLALVALGGVTSWLLTRTGKSVPASAAPPATFVASRSIAPLPRTGTGPVVAETTRPAEQLGEVSDAGRPTPGGTVRPARGPAREPRSLAPTSAPRRPVTPAPVIPSALATTPPVGPTDEVPAE